MKKNLLMTVAAMVSLMVVCACGTKVAEPKMEGLYTYQHAFEYDMDGCHFDVHESGTMAFCADSTALDSARQVYTVVHTDGDTATIVFNYISPSRWHLDGDTLFFAGIKEQFRMEAIECGDRERDLAQRVIDIYSGGIDYEYRFHLDTLTDERLQWSFTYRDGHSDTWEFNRVSE